ncbi:MAG: CDP-alcohol phosphatidyltransferase family protein [Cyclobacteriaceae bacterium]|nr:CDP-alcohol phosphatidyltransferase family protein [Cyclobacteriaceae bacterium]MDH4295261.1 CDP-alcohol phosphatidyltransferase family protein [Cyclobacteriaceae bacterium]MDH5249380.1 CDP-alcohol phosphatidyltransferase family protein [Cyclobacteriaceae bacterium]
MNKVAFYAVNAITFYRAIAAPVILFFIIRADYEVFKWLLAFSFFTDAIDGYLARWLKVDSIAGARLDSIADDLTIVAAITGLVVFERDFLNSQLSIIIALLVLFTIQTLMALIRYRKVTSYHTYLAKLAAVLQGLSLMQVFFFTKPLLVLFYAAATVTALELIEEMVLVVISPVWQANVKGLYWVLKSGKKVSE